MRPMTRAELVAHVRACGEGRGLRHLEDLAALMRAEDDVCLRRVETWVEDLVRRYSEAIEQGTGCGEGQL